MSRPKSKRKLRKSQNARARKRYAERKKLRLVELRAQSVSVVTDSTSARRPSVARKAAN